MYFGTNRTTIHSKNVNIIYKKFYNRNMKSQPYKNTNLVNFPGVSDRNGHVKSPMYDGRGDMSDFV
jgi:hypothetical protein